MCAFRRHVGLLFWYGLSRRNSLMAISCSCSPEVQIGDQSWAQKAELAAVRGLKIMRHYGVLTTTA
jgi:hypothetical protein